jgi:hypothetical protein
MMESIKPIVSLVRAAVQALQRNRVGGAVVKAVQATFMSFGRVLHRLWLEVTGFTFLAIAAIGAIAGVREYAKYQSHNVGPGRLLLAICFTASFTWFGLSSFWRVNKRVSRQRN